MFSAFLDTCVLVPSLSRDVLLEVAEQSVYRPLWSSEVLDELERTVRRLTAERGVAPDVVDSYVGRLLAQMNRAFPDALVDGWQPLVEAISLPDATDRHIVAAALSGRADVIVTEDQRISRPRSCQCRCFRKPQIHFCSIRSTCTPAPSWRRCVQSPRGLDEMGHRGARPRSPRCCGTGSARDSARHCSWHLADRVQHLGCGRRRAAVEALVVPKWDRAPGRLTYRSRHHSRSEPIFPSRADRI